MAGQGSRAAAAAAAGAVMAELVQGQSAPVGMKAEGFVDALHRVRQVRGAAGWREHGSPRRSRAGPDGEEGVGPGPGAARADPSVGLGRS